MEPKPQRKRIPRKQRQQLKQEIKQEVKQEVKKEERKPLPRRQTVTISTASGERQLRVLQQKVKKLEKCESGPKVQDSISTTLTLGVVTGSPHNDLTRNFKTFLNPALLKPHDAGKTATPLTTRASQYTMYKISRVSARLVPLVGKNIVSGSIVIVALDQEPGSAKPDNLDDTKARPHVEVPLGRATTWRIPPKHLRGPRSGWWLVDTNEQPTSALGPGLDVWTYGRTYNLLGAGGQQQNNTIFEGPLFLFELTVTYLFSNYTPKPGLATMGCRRVDTAVGDAKFNKDLDGALLLQLRTGSAFARALDEPEGPYAPQAGALGSIIWTITSKVFDTVAEQFGPWGWLLRAGFLVVRKIWGPGRAQTTVNYKVYASIEDAQKDESIFPDFASEVQVPQGHAHVTQITSPNLNENLSRETPAGASIPLGFNYLPLGDTPIQPDLPPPLYYPSEDGGYIPGITPSLNWNNLFCVYATGKIHQKIHAASKYNFTVKLSYKAKKPEWPDHIQIRSTWGEQYCVGVAMELSRESLILFGPWNQRLGAMHTWATYMSSIETESQKPSSDLLKNYPFWADLAGFGWGGDQEPYWQSFRATFYKEGDDVKITHMKWWTHHKAHHDPLWQDALFFQNLTQGRLFLVTVTRAAPTEWENKLPVVACQYWDSAFGVHASYWTITGPLRDEHEDDDIELLPPPPGNILTRWTRAA